MQENEERALASSALSQVAEQTHAPEPKQPAAQTEAADLAESGNPLNSSTSGAKRTPLLINIPDDVSSRRDTDSTTHQSPSLQSPNRHIERLKEQVTQTTDTPWPGLSLNSPKASPLPWPGLELAQQSTAEAELPALRGGASYSPVQAYSPTWVDGGGTHSPDSPLSLSEAVSRRASRAKRGRQRTYFNSSRSVSSAESSPRAPPPPPLAVDAASLAAHSLRSYVRSPRWAEQPGNSSQSPQVLLQPH